MLKNGQITLFTGCMYSGKSLNLIKKTLELEKSYECFKPSIDIRNGDFIVSRDITNMKLPAKRINNLEEILESKAEIIVLDEIQFFSEENFTSVIKKLKKNNKIVLMSGLDRIANGEFWKIYLIAESLADKVIKLTAKCDLCGNIATYSKKISGTSSDVEIENGNVKYIPVCEKCFKS